MAPGHDENPREGKPIVDTGLKTATIVLGFPLAGLTLLRHHVDHWAAPDCFLRSGH